MGCDEVESMQQKCTYQLSTQLAGRTRLPFRPALLSQSGQAICTLQTRDLHQPVQGVESEQCVSRSGEVIS